MNPILAGGLVGAAKGGEIVYKQWGDEELTRMREEAQTLRQQALIAAENTRQDKRLAHEVTLESEIKPQAARTQQGLLAPGRKIEADEAADRLVDVERRKPRTLAPGSSEVIDGKVTLTAPIEKPQELLDYYTANANRLNAEADAIRDGLKYRERGGAGRPEKPTLPKVKVVDQDGEKMIVDEHSGAVGKIIPGAPEVKAKEGILGFGSKAGSPAKPQSMEWTLNGEVLPGGLGDIYPELRSRGVGAGGRAPETAPVPGARKASDGKWYVQRDGKNYPVVEVPDAAPPKAPASAPAAQAASGPIEGVNAPRQSTMPSARGPLKSEAIERALKAPNLTTQQKSVLSLQLQEALREEGVYSR